MVKHLRFTIRNEDTGRNIKRVKCRVAGASYNVKQRARNCIADAVSHLGCEQGSTRWGEGVVLVKRCHGRRR